MKEEEILRKWECKGIVFSHTKDKVFAGEKDITDTWWKNSESGKIWLPYKEGSLKGVTKQWLDDHGDLLTQE